MNVSQSRSSRTEGCSSTITIEGSNLVIDGLFVDGNFQNITDHDLDAGTFTYTFTKAASNTAIIYFNSTGKGDYVGFLNSVVVTQTTADGHVARWYSQSDPVDTYTADFSGGVDNFVANGDNTLTGGLSITDEYGTTIDNVLELSCKNTNDTQHPMRKNNPFGGSNPINGKTLKCSFKMLVPSGQTKLVSAALSDGNLTTNGILGDGKVTEQGRWTTFTDVAWTQTALQSRLIFMGLDSNDDPEFVADVGEKFYIADVVLTETTDAYNGTDSQQPVIVEGGDVVLENGKPAIQFDGVDDMLQKDFAPDIAQPLTLFHVRRYRSNGVKCALSYNGATYADINVSSQFRSNYGSYIGGPSQNTSQGLWYSLANGTSSEIALDGATATSGSAGTNGLEKLTIGSANGSLITELTTQEIIIFNSDQSTNL